MLAALLLSLFSHPELLTEGEALFNSIAHGEGGTAKIAAVAANVQQLAATAVGVAAVAKAQQAAAPAA